MIDHTLDSNQGISHIAKFFSLISSVTGAQIRNLKGAIGEAINLLLFMNWKQLKFQKSKGD